MVLWEWLTGEECLRPYQDIAGSRSGPFPQGACGGGTAEGITVEAYNRRMREQAMSFSFDFFGTFADGTHLGCVTEGTDVRQPFHKPAIATGKAASVSVVGECGRTGRTTRYLATVSTDQRAGISSLIQEQQNPFLAR